MTESNVIRLGEGQTSTFIAGINGTNVSGGLNVVIDSNGLLGTISSSRRYKENIHDMGEASDGLLKLRPVTFRYKGSSAEIRQQRQYGLIAEEVADVYPDLVVHNKDGQVESVQYWKLDTMLLNELQKLAKERSEDLERLGGLQAQVEQLQLQVNAQRKQIETDNRVREAQLRKFAVLCQEVERLQSVLGSKTMKAGMTKTNSTSDASLLIRPVGLHPE